MGKAKRINKVEETKRIWKLVEETNKAIERADRLNDILKSCLNIEEK
jgi:hypothetical protein